MNILYIAMSLDGYIAREDDSVDWLIGDGSEGDNLGTYKEFYQSIDMVVMGYKTYAEIINVLSPNEWPYLDKKCYVLSKNHHFSSSEGIEQVQSFSQLEEKIKGKKVWICGGSQLVRLFWDHNQIDELRVAIIPAILGKGILLFQSEKEERLQLKKVETYNGIVEIHYQCKN